ncbi:hypothetical protein O181_115543 [Austropuccinia psidii MF-1]|uniref:Uncharacterized protein n=1 Tax=Austropuccinia psidii MF-1 TaxID=1389203 RepID=A0A9Q3K6M7_9BASI|nr:hypothetical protein [Austropuccinia psidii MF-1]
MPEPQRTDGGSAKGEESVSSVSLELMAKELYSRRIHCIRILHSNAEDFINEPGHKPAMALNLGPNPSPKTFPAMLRKVSFYGPGPSQWAQTIWVRKWSMAICMVPWAPGILA